MTTEPTIRIGDAAAMTNLSRATLASYADRGLVRCVRIGNQRRFYPSDLERLNREGTTNRVKARPVKRAHRSASREVYEIVMAKQAAMANG